MADDLITKNAAAMWTATSASSSSTSWMVTVVPANLGDLMVFTPTFPKAGNMTALTGGGCPASGSGLPGAWERIAGPYEPASSAQQQEIWMGKVTTTGSQTLTATISGMSAGSNVRRNCKEFGTGGGIGTVWSQDGAYAVLANGTSATVTYPTLTPSGPNRLYVGFGVNGTGLATGQTAGYFVELDPGTNVLLYNASVAQSAQSPISTQSGTSSASFTIAALIKADNPATNTGQFLPFFGGMAHHEDELEQRRSGLYVRRSFGYRKPGRVLVRTGH